MSKQSDVEMPSREVLEQFGVRFIAPLGGRLNRHWHVKAGRSSLVLRRWAPEWADTLDYELHLLEQLAARGWPVAPAIAGPIEADGYQWSLAELLQGEPFTMENAPVEQRVRGRLLAQLHADLSQLQGFGQRGKWRRCEEILYDSALEQLMTEHERERAEEVAILRWHLNRSRERIAELELETWPGMVVHGDFTAWNLRFQQERLTGILDFELSHWDHRVGDFPLSWRGCYDEVIHGYDEIWPLSPQEWELLTPLWWAFLIECGCQNLRNGKHDDGWVIKKLLQRSPLMGPDAVEFR